jgi:hypothetical protein
MIMNFIVIIVERLSNYARCCQGKTKLIFIIWDNVPKDTGRPGLRGRGT